MGRIPDAARPARESHGPGLKLLAAILSASPDAIVVLDSGRQVVYANPRYVELTGIPLESVLGRDTLVVVPEPLRETVQTYCAEVVAGRSEPLQATGFHADGTELEVEVKATVMELDGKQYQIHAMRDVTERQRQARRAAALAQASASIATSESIDAILDAISECVLAGTRALAAWVTLDGEDLEGLRAGAAGVPDGVRDYLRSAASGAPRSMYKRVVAGRGVVVYADWRQQAERELGTACRLTWIPWQTAVIAGLQHQGTAIGVLVALYREGEIPYATETAFLAALADQAATAAANARLLVAARQKVMLEERQRLSRELHDSVSQSLYAIQLEAQTALDRIEGDPAGAAQPIDQIRRLAEASQAEMRALIFELRPEALEREGLVAVLDRQIEAFRARYGIAARLVAPTEPPLALDVKEALQAIAHQALCNTGKHAWARQVDVHLGTNAGAVVLEVADDGVGFDPDGSFPGHLGLRSMHERAAGVGGSLEVVSAPGRGTRITVTVEAGGPHP